MVAERLIEALESSPNIVCRVMAGVGVGVLVVLGVGVVAISPVPRFNSQTIAATRISPIPSRANRRHLLTPVGPFGTEINGACSFTCCCLTTGGANGGVMFGICGRDSSAAFIGGIVILGIGAGIGLGDGNPVDGTGMLGATSLGAVGMAGLGALS